MLLIMLRKLITKIIIYFQPYKQSGKDKIYFIIIIIIIQILKIV